MIIAYARHSWRPDDSESCGNQLADIRSWAQSKGHKIRAEFRDELISGAQRDREGLAAATQAAKRGDLLVVREWGRMARDTLFMLTLDEELSKKGVTLYSLQEGKFSDSNDPMVEVISTFRAALKKEQRLVISMMTSKRMRQHQANGRRMSHQTPYGTAVDDQSPPSIRSVKAGQPRPGGLTEDQEEAAAVARIRELAACEMGLRPIARVLNQEGYRSRGAKWRAQTVKRILEREN